MNKADANRILKAAEHLLKAAQALDSIKSDITRNAAIDSIADTTTIQEMRNEAESLMDVVKEWFPS